MDVLRVGENYHRHTTETYPEDVAVVTDRLLKKSKLVPAHSLHPDEVFPDAEPWNWPRSAAGSRICADATLVGHGGHLTEGAGAATIRNFALLLVDLGAIRAATGPVA
ncbi:hypothetical protein [Micromonospora sp. LOL_021]|uniref:hypothetical protein n=1 Tax=Micromonospora sp. LOL_021 TaxID=3345417 RepID=UPI003A8C445C